MSRAPSTVRSHREPATVRIAMWSARHRWPVVGLWFVAAIGLFAVSLAMGGIDAGDPNGNPDDQKLEANAAIALFTAGGKNDPYEQFLVVIDGGPGAVSDPEFQAAVGVFERDLDESRSAFLPSDGESLVQSPVHLVARQQSQLDS